MVPVPSASTDTSTKDGQLNSSDSSANPKPSLNNDDKKRLDSIKKELERLKDEAKADAQESPAAVVKPGSLASDSGSNSDGGKTGSQDDKSIDKPMMEEEKEKPDAAPSSPPPQKTSKGASLNFLMVLGPLFLVGALGFSVYNLKFKPRLAETYVAERGAEKETEEIKTGIKNTLSNAPLNPTQATATCQSTGETITSGQPSTCPDPIFTWSGEKTREKGTKIIGYWVYFGEKKDTQPLYYGEKGKSQDLSTVIRPIVDGQLQEENQYKPIGLQKGKTYHLAVSAKSDSKTRLWSFGLTNPDPTNLKAQAAEILFTFIYE